jgi:hypothetical protein
MLSREDMSSADRTFSIAERATELMRAYSECASPQSYEIWFTYVSGVKPFLNEAVKNALRSGQKLTQEQIGALYDAHLAPNRHDRRRSGLDHPLRRVAARAVG